jgi:hypothetical protein
LFHTEGIPEQQVKRYYETVKTEIVLRS